MEPCTCATVPELLCILFPPLCTNLLIAFCFGRSGFASRAAVAANKVALRLTAVKSTRTASFLNRRSLAALVGFFPGHDPYIDSESHTQNLT